MARQVRRVIAGDTASFALDVRLLASAAADVEHLGWMGVHLWLNGRRVWSSGRQTLNPVEWTWLDLVEWLARAWPYIQYEENAPFGLVADGPEKLGQASVLRRRNLNKQTAGEAIWAYQARHDMAAGLKGIHLPSVYLLPEGTNIRVRTGGKDVWVPRAELLETLSEFVDVVLAATEGDATGRAKRARRWWDERTASTSVVDRLRTGVERATLREWAGDVSDAELFGAPDETETEFMAAARLSATLSEEDRCTIVRAIREVPSVETPALNELSAQARSVLVAIERLKPFEQGYALAVWLRSGLELDERPVSPMSLLEGWGVVVRDLPPAAPELDAVACWGAQHGPAVLTNPEGRHSGSAAGRRATLAHEVLHLLVDRGRSLPAAEVFGGTTPVHLEQRARAFAAEFLVPRRVVAKAIARGSYFAETCSMIRGEYQVSNELLGWQIWNSEAKATLSAEDRKLVDCWRRAAP